MLEAERGKLEVRKNYFTVRAIKNDLPEATKKPTTINGFKNSYDSWKNKAGYTAPDASSFAISVFACVCMIVCVPRSLVIAAPLTR